MASMALAVLPLLCLLQAVHLSLRDQRDRDPVRRRPQGHSERPREESVTLDVAALSRTLMRTLGSAGDSPELASSIISAVT